MSQILLSPTGTVLRQLGSAAAGGAGAAFASPRALAYPMELARKWAELPELGDHQVYVAWMLCRPETALPPKERDALLVLVLAALSAVGEGHAFLSLEKEALESTLTALGITAEERTAIHRLAAHLLAGNRCTVVSIADTTQAQTPLLIDRAETALYLARMYDDEIRLATNICRRIDVGPRQWAKPPAGGAVAQAVAHTTLSLTAEQQAAVASALDGGFTVVTGGPGTGKTSVVAEILRAFVAGGGRPEEIALAAPTGKAASRLGGAIANALSPNEGTRWRHLPSPETLHRLLGYSPSQFRFRHGTENPLPERLVVVDEGSMIDMSTMRALLEAVRPDAHLVVLGDADQLPSVEAGAAFRDLSLSPGTVRLTQSFRMDPRRPEGRAVLTLAHALRDGVALPPTLKKSALSALTMTGVEWLATSAATSDGLAALEAFYFDEAGREAGKSDEAVDNDAAMRQAMLRIYDWTDTGFAPTDAVRIAKLLHAQARWRMLCVTHGQATGTRRLNEHFAGRLAERLGLREAGTLPPGSPLLVVKNDYARHLYNGDQGIALRVRVAGEKPQLRAVFAKQPGNSIGGQIEGVVFVVHSVGPTMEPGFVQTVHKAQGSEHDGVAIILPQNDTPLLTQELLYTAVTRSRKTVLIVGSDAILQAGRMRKLTRRTGLSQRLGQAKQALHDWPAHCRSVEL